MFVSTGVGKTAYKIPKVMNEDGGAYICKATNKHGKVEGEMTVSISGKECVY